MGGGVLPLKWEVECCPDHLVYKAVVCVSAIDYSCISGPADCILLCCPLLSYLLRIGQVTAVALLLYINTYLLFFQMSAHKGIGSRVSFGY